jgi:hypothetical protein
MFTSSLRSPVSSLMFPPTRGTYVAKNRIPRHNPARRASASCRRVTRRTRPLQPDGIFHKKRKGDNSGKWSPCAPWSPSTIPFALSARASAARHACIENIAHKFSVGAPLQLRHDPSGLPVRPRRLPSPRRAAVGQKSSHSVPLGKFESQSPNDLRPRRRTKLRPFGSFDVFSRRGKKGTKVATRTGEIPRALRLPAIKHLESSIQHPYAPPLSPSRRPPQ